MKIGILTFHYSNNFGGVLQALALQKSVSEMGFDVEIINYIPTSYDSKKTLSNLGIRKNIFKNKISDLNILELTKKVSIMKKYNKLISMKFNSFRDENMLISKEVNESSLTDILINYDAIIVGSDQVWNPSQRKSHIYFLNFGENYKGKKISYAADSTIKEVINDDVERLYSALNCFDSISVRNDHSYDFVKSIVDTNVEIVADPTLLYDFDKLTKFKEIKEDYILTYVLGKEIDGSHEKAIEKIREKHGNIPVYSIKIPTMKFELSGFADKVFYNLSPDEWLNMFRNAKFIYTDSFHGVLFSLKYHKPFLAYYTEKLRATRFIDLGKRYNIDRYIVQNTTEIDDKQPLEELPDFEVIDKIINLQKESSLGFLKKALS